MEKLLEVIRHCNRCRSHLPGEPKPVLAASKTSKICIVGQAPGLKVHESGIPWKDRSGGNLRNWLGISEKVFYDTRKIAIIPMGFCYPGKGLNSDLPPRPECAPEWHHLLFRNMPDLQLTLLLGWYAQRFYLNGSKENSLTETVKNHRNYLPEYIPMPHPSPRNRFWLVKNPWFERTLLPELRFRIKTILEGIEDADKNNT